MTPPTTLEVSWVLAFIAGVVSFLSPCVLPLIPGYVSMVSKLSYDELKEGSPKLRVQRVLLPSLLFVLGFSTVFVMLGTSASMIGNFLIKNKTLLLQISGFIIILFGLFVMELLKLGPLYREAKLDFHTRNLGHVGTFLLGVAFGFGWTPCVGPILASILLYASTAQGAHKGALLLFTYSLGLGLPFIITGLLLSQALSAFGWIKRHYGAYKYSVGGILVALGLLMLTNNIFYLNIYGQKFMSALGIDFWQRF